jgi:hypothetical protein
MKKLAVLFACSMSLGALGLAASAAPAAKMDAKMSTKTTVKKTAEVTCPACKKMGMAMPMTATKTKVNARAVKVNGKTMYCCTKCKMKTMTTAKKAPAKKM